MSKGNKAKRVDRVVVKPSSRARERRELRSAPVVQARQQKPPEPAVARREPGGPIQQLVLRLVTENRRSDSPVGYDDIAEMVREEIPGARTTAKSVASMVYRSHLSA